MSTKHLSASDYFSALNHDQLALLVSHAEIRTFARGENLMHQSDATTFVYFILTGRTEVLVTQVGSEDHNEVIATIGPGDVVGERALLGRPRRSATVRAREDVEVLAWEAAKFRALFDEHQDIGYVVMQALAQKLSDRLVNANNNLRNALTAQALL